MKMSEMEVYNGEREVPNDFIEFWAMQLALIQELPEYRMIEKNFFLKNASCFDFYFRGTNRSQIYAKVIFPKQKDNCPVIFHFHGYQGRSSDWSEYLKFASEGYAVVAMDVRGQAGKSEDKGLFSGTTVKGQVIRGMREGPEHLFYKDIYLDVYTLIELIATFPQVNSQRLMTYGASQGGALAIVGGALNRKISKIVAIYPFLSDFPRVIHLGQETEPYDELFRYFKFVDPLYDTQEKIFSTLDYIDIKNFGSMISGQVKLVTGLRDDVCPPSTQFAFYNRVNSEKEQIILPEYGHEAMNVMVNDKIFNWLTESSIEEV
ncbi:acetylxylan esterase [Candidatus Enterococcus huntleyi]|uniref:acetylxylan esterase n=1 Tax=Candidatus Enterococcus huntleyi TaxID=1857217 RepID=UPI003075B676